ncbi:KpsF/GutQ family sugar-phosphate isomerase [Amaricoccus sp.]|uniref:KpsF/GutQ family sugar-phosphate isomerase n=1 Tax=Amaricoccus sp. TaxID=1872485 RepID=UPI001B521B03|nr:KpsF/GutQ family sugar-phosphate isomerase [Amaricoccus sp.]MBP7242874.1 KpsF/GutQ family sugar-phosphate isomerase [Amaricoccus sp.]
MPEDAILRDASLIASGRRVIGIEAAALASLADALGDSFAAAAQLLLATRGRVIVSGMGKSGHVARKIAATLASTGTPAFFVHPAEASHGDLGMITRDDVVMLLSNSGETPELADLIAYTRRFAIPLVAVAGRAESTLIAQADVGIVLPPAPEACPVGLAPTTSTTMTLALGDALAVALMETRAFTPAEFRDLHPGGRLGARLATVGQLIHRGDEAPLVGMDAGMPEALLEMTAKGFGVVGVTDAEGRLVGVVTDGDLRRHMDGLLSRGVAEVMTRAPRTIATTALASEALGIMNGSRITTLFAIDPAAPGRPAGVLHVHDCLRAGVA